MNTLRNIHFTLLIKINSRLREFNFRKRSSELFDSDTSDERGTRFQFKLVRKEGHWEISTPGLPAWIMDHSDQIAAAVQEEDSKY